MFCNLYPLKLWGEVVKIKIFKFKNLVINLFINQRSSIHSSLENYELKLEKINNDH